MAQLENEMRISQRRGRVQKAILNSVKIAGVLSVALLAPNALQVLKMFDNGGIRKRDPKYGIETSFQKLLKKRMVRIEVVDSNKYVLLTTEGERALRKMGETANEHVAPQKWDRLWRIVIYDIRERKRSTRIQLQQTLRTFGFYKLQHSVWVYPYDCEDLIVLLKADFKIGREVLYLIATKIENDRKLCEYFSLS